MYFNVIQSMQRRNKFNTMPDFKTKAFVGPIRESSTGGILLLLSLLFLIK